MEKYVRIAFVMAGILVWVTLAAFFASLFAFLNPNWDFMIIGSRFTLSDLLGLAGGAAVAIALLFHRRANQLGLEVVNELRNVTWPTWPETRISTIVVIAMTIIVSLILGLFDAFWGMLTAAIYRV